MMKLKHFLFLLVITCGVIIVPNVNAQSFNGYFNMYYVKSTNSGKIPQNYTNTIGFSFPTTTYYQIPGSTIVNGSSTAHQFSVITRADLQPTFNFVKGNQYTITLHFDTGSYIYYWFPTNDHNDWFVSSCTNNFCTGSTTTYTYTTDSTHQNVNTLNLTIKFTANSNVNNPIISIGNLTDNRGIMYNAFSVQQGVRISSSNIEVVEQSVDLSPVIENNNQNTQNIINNNNQNTQNIINSQNETTDAINDINDTLKDDTLPDVINSGGGGGTYFDDINQSSDTPISDLLLLPVNLLIHLEEGIKSSCTPYTIPFDFTGGSNKLTFPCINLENYLGSSLWTIIDGLFSIFMLYNIFMLCVATYDHITNLDDLFPSFYYNDIYTGRHEPGQYEPRHGGD